jgi:hypothetical protein
MLKLLAQGNAGKSIALELGVAHSTVLTTLHNAYKLLGVQSGPQAVAVAWEAGWMDPVGVDHRDERVTPAQRLYLDAFDLYLAAISRRAARRLGLPHGPEALVAARLRMEHHLDSVFLESWLGMAPVERRGRPPRDLAAVLSG